MSRSRTITPPSPASGTGRWTVFNAAAPTGRTGSKAATPPSGRSRGTSWNASRRTPLGSERCAGTSSRPPARRSPTSPPSASAGRSSACSARLIGRRRISPCELDFAGGQLFLDDVAQPEGARSPARSPVRAALVHRSLGHRGRREGVRPGRPRAGSRDETGLPRRRRGRIDWAPDEPHFHAFAVDVRSAGFISFAEPRTVLAWDPERGTRSLPLPDPE